MEVKDAQVQTVYHQTFRRGGGLARTRKPAHQVAQRSSVGGTGGGVYPHPSLPRHRFPGSRALQKGVGHRPALDVWEPVELYQGKGTERLLSEHNVSERQLDLALSYYETYPREIDEALEENTHSPEEWHEISPSVIPSPPTRS